jgi:hypothetical protein
MLVEPCFPMFDNAAIQNQQQEGKTFLDNLNNKNLDTSWAFGMRAFNSRSMLLLEGAKNDFCILR